MTTTYEILLDTPNADMSGRSQAILPHWDHFIWSDVLGGRPSLTVNTLGEIAVTSNIESLVTDLVLVRNDVDLYRGRIVPTTDTITASGDYRLDIGVVSYEALLEWRIIEQVPREYNNWLQGEIAWDLIKMAQAQPGGDLGLVQAPVEGDNTVRRSRLFNSLGTPVARMLDDLGDNDKGFDWWITPGDKAFHLMAPHRGIDRTGATPGVAALSLALGSQVESVKRTSMAERYFNAGVVVGATAEVTMPNGTIYPPPAPVFFDKVNTNTRRGRWARAISYPDIVTNESLQSKALYEETKGLALRPTYALHLALGVWDPSLFGLGDTVMIEIGAAPRLDVVVAAQITEIRVSVNAAGEESVDISAVAVGDEFAGSVSPIPPDEDIPVTPPGDPPVLLYSAGRTPGTLRLDEPTEMAQNLNKMIDRITALERGSTPHP
jgi:hypothetical protein